MRSNPWLTVNVHVTLPALQRFQGGRMLPAQRCLLGRVARLALKGDALLHGRVAEGVSAPAELLACFGVVIWERGRGSRRGDTRGFLILLRKMRCRRI